MKLMRGFNNLWYGFLGQLIILSLGLFIPRFILRSYGDEANGLIGAIGQIFIYLSLIESGVGQASVNSLYNPIVNNDRQAISKILSATKIQFRKLTKIYFIFVILVAFIYPLLISISDQSSIMIFDSTYIGLLAIVLFQGLSNASNFYFVSTYKQLMIADGKTYLISNITTFIRVTSTFLRLVLINIGINLVYLQFVYLLIAVVEIALYKFVMYKYYPWVDFSMEPNIKALHQKSSFVIHEISSVIFNNTDILILSVFCDLRITSIYVIYNMVFSALNGLISQVHNSLNFMLGQQFNENIEKYIVLHDIYDSFYISLVFALISVAYIVINPFIVLYTSGLTDLIYVDRYLPILFSSIQLLSCIRITNSNLVKIAGHAKFTISRTILESAINISVSLILVNFIGLYGVLVGTICALLYRSNDFIIYANLRILKRSPITAYKTVLLNFMLFVFVIITDNYIKLEISSISSFFLWGSILTVLSFLVYFTTNILFNLKSLKRQRIFNFS